jgi:hypothetical protein
MDWLMQLKDNRGRFFVLVNMKANRNNCSGQDEFRKRPKYKSLKSMKLEIFFLQ